MPHAPEAPQPIRQQQRIGLHELAQRRMELPRADVMAVPAR
jgi:hypothetical protein